MKNKFNSTTLLIDEFRNKAGAWQSQDKAEKIKNQLKSLISDDDYWKLSIAHSHYKIGESTEELYDVCKELMRKYA